MTKLAIKSLGIALLVFFLLGCNLALSVTNPIPPASMPTKGITKICDPTELGDTLPDKIYREYGALGYEKEDFVVWVPYISGEKNSMGNPDGGYQNLYQKWHDSELAKDPHYKNLMLLKDGYSAEVNGGKLSNCSGNLYFLAD